MTTQTGPDTVSETTPEQPDAVLAAAHDAVGPLGPALPAERAAWIMVSADVLVPLAEEESWLSETRLRGEVARSSGQLRMFVDALRDPRVRASGFTGSVADGRARREIAMSRSDPNPFHGEPGTGNLSFTLLAVVRERWEEIATGFVASYTLGVGQSRAKPGLLFPPAGQELQDKAVNSTRGVSAATMLNAMINQGCANGPSRLRERKSLDELATGSQSDQGAPASLLRTTVPRLLAEAGAVLRECFGPVSIIVEYADATAALPPALQDRAGRVVWKGCPTCVAVSWAMHRGGLLPATVRSIHTSMGTTVARRFQHPFCFEDVPAALLHEALRDENPLGTSRRVNGEVTRSWQEAA